MSSGAEEEVLAVAEAGDVAEAVTGAEEAWVAAAGAAEAGVAAAGAAEAGPAEALSVEVGVAVAGATDALSVEAGVAAAGAGVVGGLYMAMVTGVVAHTGLHGPIAGAVFPTAFTEDTAALGTARRW